jgi:tetraacyldisaccharide 4'-kinase
MRDDHGSPARLIERLWFGADRGAEAARTLLSPFEKVFGGVVGVRDMLYDAGWLRARDTAIPAVSIGNLTVGGTGKTPVAAWIARELALRGAKPAIVMRGYGEDEPLVHRILNPGIPVVVGADRVAAVGRAAAAGADIAVLDDAFQHRRARRVADLVLISADRWTGDARMLPAGPFREPLRAVRRATMVIVTRKAATDEQVDAVHTRLAQAAPTLPRVSLHLSPGPLVRADDPGETKPLESLAGGAVHAILAIGDPDAFVRQLEERGVRVHPRIYPDHHRFSSDEIQRFASSLHTDDTVVCTLKDAVKLAPRWPRLAPPLWYVSQQVMVERGVGGLEHLLDSLVRSRSRTSLNAG